MSTVQSERVLVVPTERLHELGYFQGFTADTGRYLPELLRPEYVCFRPRGEMEENPNFKQLIPYVIFRHRGRAGGPSLFQYTRGTGQGESRLHRQRSVGIGGHIASVDAESSASCDPYREGMQRELGEEVLVETPYCDRCVGLINDDETDVGKVHLGIVHLMDVDQPAVRPREPEIVDAGFRPVDELLGELAQFESWSQICLQALFGVD